MVGEATVNFGGEILERDYACGAQIAQKQNYLKLNVRMQAGSENGF